MPRQNYGKMMTREVLNRGGGPPKGKLATVCPQLLRCRRARPHGAHELDSPQRAAEKQGLFRFHEGWCLPAKNPHMRVWWLLPNQRRDQSGDAADFDLQNVVRCSMGGTVGRERFLSSRRDGQLHETPFRRRGFSEIPPVR
jgi:hypothetical protein